METLDKIKALRNSANEIRTLFNKKIPTWKADRHNYDKTRWGFESGSSDGWYKDCEINIWFMAWCGTYGNSSVYSEIRLDGKIWKSHFLKYLNIHKEEIMMAIADSIEQEAKELKSAAETELNQELAKLSELEK